MLLSAFVNNGKNLSPAKLLCMYFSKQWQEAVVHDIDLAPSLYEVCYMDCVTLAQARGL